MGWLARDKRDGRTFNVAQSQLFAEGLSMGTWSEVQCIAKAMAIFLRRMNHSETVEPTLALARSGKIVEWNATGLPGLILDKHSIGGVGVHAASKASASIASQSYLQAERIRSGTKPPPIPMPHRRVEN